MRYVSKRLHRGWFFVCYGPLRFKGVTFGVASVFFLPTFFFTYVKTLLISSFGFGVDTTVRVYPKEACRNEMRGMRVVGIGAVALCVSCVACVTVSSSHALCSLSFLFLFLS